MVKIVATRCQILRLKCTQLNIFRLGLRPRPRLESLQRSPDPLAGFQGSLSKRREGRGRKGRERGNKYPEWLNQKLGSTANAAVNS